MLSKSVLVGLAAHANADNRLTIVNGCSKEPMWIAHIVSGGVGPDAQDLKIQPGASAKFHTDNLPATRFWPKLGCNDKGANCTIGSSGGPGEGCVIRKPGQPDDYSHCAPPVDSKFEATFKSGSAMDVVDMSLVDGYSLPFKLETSGGTCTRAQKPFTDMDCSQLTLADCPTAETLNGKTVSLQAVNPRTGAHGGCYSPCMRLTDDKWKSDPVAPDSQQAAPFCCAGAFGSPGTCNAGPILKTKYLASVKKTCPAAYGYAYDDKVATIACTGTTEYKVTFYCPGEAPPAPSPTPTPPSPPSPPAPTPSPKCAVGDSVNCPGSTTKCAGNECCPDGTTCPSASETFHGCQKAKTEDCTKSAATDFFFF